MIILAKTCPSAIRKDGSIDSMNLSYKMKYESALQVTRIIFFDKQKQLEGIYEVEGVYKSLNRYIFNIGEKKETDIKAQFKGRNGWCKYGYE